jgi:hypothetical protein
MPNEYDRLVDIAARADLIRAVVELEGPFARRLEAEMRFFREVLGSAATPRGEVKHLVRVPALKALFAADYESLTGLPLIDAGARRRE